jgi:hypothetical protein
MIRIAVMALELGILTISPDTYFAPPERAVVTGLGWVVVFVELELSVQPVKRTQEIRSNTRPVIWRVFLFMVLTEPGDYFKKSFYAYHVFNYHTMGQTRGSSNCDKGNK